MANPRDVEILIHIAAPSKASDDVRYRSLASAYTDFRPRKRQRLSEPESIRENTDPVLPTTTQEVASRSHHEPSQQILSSGQWLPSLTSPQASFDNVLDNANSPLRLARQQILATGAWGPASQETVPKSSWETPPSFVQDSVPENDVTAALLATPTRVLEHYLQHFTSPSQTTQRRAIRTETPQQNSKSCSSDNALAEIGHNLRETTIPCTPGNRLPPVSSVELGKTSSVALLPHISQSTGVPDTDEDIVEETVIIQDPRTPPRIRADSEPPASKRRPEDRTNASPGALLRTSSDVGPHRVPDGSRRTITSLPVHGCDYKNLESNPPEPPAGCASIAPDDLITPDLRDVAAYLKIPKRYKPASISRELRPFERGYWTIDCTDWPQDLKTETWIFLANYVAKGYAGWGVSCKRDERFSWMRLYCWGSLVAHVYLLIYMASRRRVCFSDASWVDGAGSSVVVMGKTEGVWTRL